MLLNQYASRKARYFNDPGKLDRQVQLLIPNKTRDAINGTVINWQVAATTWASYTATPGREIQQAAQKLGLAAATFRIRYFPGITAEWRVLFGGNFFELISPPIELGRQFYLDLICQAIAPGSMDFNGVGMQSLVVDLTEGTDSQVIAYPVAFASLPSGIKNELLIPVGGSVFEVATVDLSRSTTGHTVNFGASVPGPGYKLSVIVTS